MSSEWCPGGGKPGVLRPTSKRGHRLRCAECGRLFVRSRSIGCLRTPFGDPARPLQLVAEHRGRPTTPYHKRRVHAPRKR